MNQTLLTLVCNPSLERPVIDWLLEQETIAGFTSMSAYGHGSNPDKLNLIEQVEGRKKQVLFQIYLDSETSELVINELQKSFNGTKIHYWLTPLIKTGNLE